MARQRARSKKTEIRLALQAVKAEGLEKVMQIEIRPDNTTIISPFIPSPMSAPAEAERDGSEIIL